MADLKVGVMEENRYKLKGLIRMPYGSYIIKIFKDIDPIDGEDSCITISDNNKTLQIYDLLTIEELVPFLRAIFNGDDITKFSVGGRIL